MYVRPNFSRQSRDPRWDERFSPSGGGPPSLRLTLLGFTLLLGGLLGTAVVVPPSLATSLVANTLAAAP